MTSDSGPGPFNVKSMLRDASTPFSVDQLHWNGIRHLRVISPEKMAELINRSVRTIIDKHRLMALNHPPSAEQIERESKAEFNELVDQFHQTTAATSAVERSRQELAEGLEETRSGPYPMKDESAPVTGETWVLQRRIEKLLQHITTMEAAIKTLSSAKVFSNQHVQNVLRELGLAQEDKHAEKKKEMLRVVLSENQDIRRKARDLAARGITLAAPGGMTTLAGSGPSRDAACSRRSA